MSSLRYPKINLNTYKKWVTSSPSSLSKGGRKFSKNQSEISHIASILEICRANGEGLTHELLALEIFPGVNLHYQVT